MISINLFVPWDEVENVDMKENETFKIISCAKHNFNLTRFFIIETTEEEVTFLTLKYGKENVWKR